MAVTISIIVIIGDFGNERVYFFLSSVFGDTRRDTQFIEAYDDHTMLTPTLRTVHLVVSKISIHLCRSKPQLIGSHQIRKPPPHASTVVPQLPSFQNPKILGHDVSHQFSSLHGTSSPISCMGVYKDKWLFSYPFRADTSVPRLTITLKPRDTE